MTTAREDVEAAVGRLQHFVDYGLGYDVATDVRTLIKIAKAASENVTIDVPGPGGVTQRYTVSGVAAIESTGAVRIDAITSRPAEAHEIRVNAPDEFILTTCGTIRIATDQPYTIKTIPPAREAVREYR